MSGLFASDWTARRAALTPDSTALVDVASGARITFEALERRVNQTARWLEGRGVGASDRVAVLAHNSVAYLEVWLACQKLGAILQTLNWRLRADTLAELLDEVEPALLLTDASTLPLAQDTLRAAGPGPKLATFEADLAGRAEASDAPLPPPPVGPEAPWVLCYTGGSTGRPKAAVLTHESVLFNAINTVIGWSLGPKHVAVLNAPLFHTGGLNVFTAPLLYAGGASLVCERFDVDQLFDLVQGGATHFFGVPTMFQLIQAHPRWPEVDLSGLELVISGGAPCPAPVFERFFARGVAFRTGYGLTEAGPNNFGLAERRVFDKPGCIGRPLPHVEARLVDGEGRALEGPDVEGELCLRGPHLMAGYWEDAAATAAAIDAAGWLRTGDLARRDADGDYTICGRSKDLVISGGENVYPAQVESVLCGHPGVAAAAVIGRPDDKWGEVPVAFVVRADPTLEAAGVLEHARGALAGYEVPKAVYFVEALPETGPGKIDKRALAERLRGIEG